MNVFDPENLKLLAPTFYQEWKGMKTDKLAVRLAPRGPNKATGEHLARLHSLAVGEKYVANRDSRNMRMVIANNKHHPSIDGKRFHIRRTSSTTCTITRTW